MPPVSYRWSSALGPNHVFACASTRRERRIGVAKGSQPLFTPAGGQNPSPRAIRAFAPTATLTHRTSARQRSKHAQNCSARWQCLCGQVAKGPARRWRRALRPQERPTCGRTHSGQLPAVPNGIALATMSTAMSTARVWTSVAPTRRTIPYALLNCSGKRFASLPNVTWSSDRI